jgi:hypothetical protein
MSKPRWQRKSFLPAERQLSRVVLVVADDEERSVESEAENAAALSMCASDKQWLGRLVDYYSSKVQRSK